MTFRPSYHRGPPFTGQGSELDRLRHEKDSLERRLSEVLSGSTQIGIVVSVDEDAEPRMVTVASAGGAITETRWPMGMTLRLGNAVRLRADASQGIGSLTIVSFAKMPEGGNVSKVERVIDEAHFECSLMNQKRLVFHDKAGSSEEPEVGDSVLLDPLLGITFTKNLGKGTSEHAYRKDTGVDWTDIGGQEEAKDALIDALVAPVTHADLFRKYKRKPARGLLLHGPPGCGKTLLGRAAATALARAHGQDPTDSGFHYVKGPALLDKWVGESEANVRRLFAATRAHLKKAGYPCVLFLDEADAVLGVRGANAGNEGMERTIVPMFLAELDGFEDSGCFFLLATNRADRLDPAIVRDGRVDRKAHVGRPTRQDALTIVSRALLGRPHKASCAEECVTAVWNPEHVLYRVTGKDGEHALTFGDLVTGARLVGLVERATTFAIRREVDGGDRGILPKDFVRATLGAVDEERGLDHTADLLEWAETRKHTIVSVVRGEKA
jgi:ATPase family associated with various cellular activities (AAA)